MNVLFKIDCIVATLFLLLACSDDSTNNVGNDDEQKVIVTYKTYSGLAAEKPCGPSLNGAIAHVVSDNLDYTCLYDVNQEDWFWYNESSKNHIRNSSSSSSVLDEPISSSVLVVLSSSSSSKTISSSSSFVIEIEYGELIDARDGKIYKTVKINDQEWMAENLNYLYPVYRKTGPNSYAKSDSVQIFCDITQDPERCPIIKMFSRCYDDKSVNCTKYGRLYSWAAALDSAGLYSKNSIGCGSFASRTEIAVGRDLCVMIAPVRGICPENWHLPSKVEWEKLYDFTAKRNSNPYVLQAKDFSKWSKALDSYGFSAKPGGYQGGDSFYSGLDSNAFFWSTTSTGSYNLAAYAFEVRSQSVKIDRWSTDGYSKIYVRCIKDEE